ncbi:MAG TPA: cation:proton antiporter [Tepidisphaeraceae bacterium]|jgi:CPA2 family monovalent cation:H+ antiporter-2|nr:cation:proton antiporter [Tepidisphaeraceae bacterium]
MIGGNLIDSLGTAILAVGEVHGLELIQDLAVIMCVAGVVTVLFRKLRQPVVLGYILAGLIVGNHTPIKLIADEANVNTWGNIGVIFLMFSLGLHFSLRKLAEVGATAFLAASLEIVGMLTLGYYVGLAFGWKPMDALFLGAILSISSTTIIIKALTELKLVKERFAEVIFGILIVEDILAIAMLALLSGIANTGGLAADEVAVTFGKLGIFLVITLVVGLLAVPPLMRFVAGFKNDEVLLVSVLGLCFGVSLIAVKMEYSIALGAFLIGAIMAEAREAGKIEALIAPVRDLFSAVFFVTVGMLIDPKVILTDWWKVLVLVAVVIVGKVITCAAGTFLAGHSTRTSMRVGMGLAQIGEFSFIIAQLGLTTGVTSPFLYPIAVAVSAITTLTTPYLIRSSDPIVHWFDRTAPRKITTPLGVYSQWVKRLGTRGTDPASEQIRKLKRKWAIQIGLNVAMITGLFVAGDRVGRHTDDWIPSLPQWTGGPKAAIWFLAVLLALPLLVATFRKMRAIAWVIAETRVTKARAKEQTRAIRTIVANTLLAGASALMILWIAILSAAVLPPWPVLVLFAVIATAVAAVRWNAMVRLYANAQVALHETLTRPHAEIDHDTETRAIPPILREASLETITLPVASPAAGLLIRELQLRTRTGASVVGIQRDGHSLVNPGPDDDLQPGDQVLLIGTQAHLENAVGLLMGTKTDGTG